MPIALVDNMTFMPGGNSDLMFFRCPAYLPVVWLQKEEVFSKKTLKAEGEARKAATAADKEEI